MAKKNSHVQATLEQIENTLRTLSDSGLTRIVKDVKTQTDKDITILTWENHTPCRLNCEKYFNSIEQYLHIYETGAYHAIIIDGSIIRFCYKFKKNILIQENLLFWPAPLSIDEDVIDAIGMRQALEDVFYQDNPEFHIIMRSPLRIDFDPSNVMETHPETHIHIQHSDCRLSLRTPICFNKFIKFIFKNFYPHLDTSSLARLTPLNYSGYTPNNKSIIAI